MHFLSACFDLGRVPFNHHIQRGCFRLVDVLLFVLPLKKAPARLTSPSAPPAAWNDESVGGSCVVLGIFQLWCGYLSDSHISLVFQRSQPRLSARPAPSPVGDAFVLLEHRPRCKKTKTDLLLSEEVVRIF